MGQAVDNVLFICFLYCYKCLFNHVQVATLVKYECISRGRLVPKTKVELSICCQVKSLVILSKTKNLLGYSLPLVCNEGLLV